MSSRNAILLATLAVATLTTSTSSWGQTSKSPSDLTTSQEDSSTQVENKTNAEPATQSSADPTQSPIDNSQIKTAKRSQRLPLSRPYRSYLPNYRSSRAYYPLSGHHNFYGGGLSGGYNLGTRWVDPNFGNHGSFNSGYNLGPIRSNPNFGNSW
jgi:hypothetical protein